MDGYLRFGILILAALILFLIGFEAWLRRRHLKAVKSYVANNHQSFNHQSPTFDDNCEFHLPPTEEPKVHIPPVMRELKAEDYFLILSVFAKENSNFGSYDLLQAIMTTGMQFGEMNIFHYFADKDQKQSKLFSLASATKPGHFNLDKIGDFSCKGLTLFMDLSEASDPELALKTMIRTAEQLADDLDGDLYADPRTRLTPAILQEYQERISIFKTLQSA